MVKDANILLLPNWDIVDALVFYFVSNNLGLQDPDREEFLGTTFSNDQAALVMWSLRRGSRTTPLQPDDSGLTGNIIVRRVVDTSNVQLAYMNVDYSKFALATVEREEKEMTNLQSKYEIVVDAYNKEVKKRIELENMMSQMEKILGKRKVGESITPRITYPSQSFVGTTPIIEIPDTLERPQFYVGNIQDMTSY